MDWTAIIVALIGACGLVVAELIRRALRDSRNEIAVSRAEAAAARAEQASIGAQVKEIESSINNRATPLSDRVDEAIKAGTSATLATVGLAKQVTDLGERFEANHAEGMAAHKQLDQRVSGISDAERASRVRLDLHIRETAFMMPMLQDLHNRWTPPPKETP